MLQSPAIIALLLCSALVSAALVFAAANGVRILRRWDLSSGSPEQLELERRTALISSILAIVMAAEILSLFLLIRVGDELHPLFTGAMCGAGTFNVNMFGYPALVLKACNALACGVWLVLNRADSLAHDYPLVRVKYGVLVPITGFVLWETYLLWTYFLSMDPDVITSCCGTLFSESATSFAGGVAGLPATPMMVAYFLGVILLVRSGFRLLRTGRGATLFSALSAVMLVVALGAVISFVSVFYYELPTHHCPFCILQPEYHYIGYPLYAALLVAGVAGLSVGMLHRYREVPSLRAVVPQMERTLCIATVAGHVVAACIAAYPMLVSDFRLTGY